MNRVLITPIVAALLLAAACNVSNDVTAVDTKAHVRFVNATTGMTGNGGFTTNDQFKIGSALAFGQSSQLCSTLDASTTSFGFGISNTGGTSLSGTALATLNNQSFTLGGNFTVVAAGPATSPKLFLLDDNFSGAMGTNQAAVRFVNLAPGASNTINVFLGTVGSGGTLAATDIAVGSPTTFSVVTNGSNAFTVLNGHDTVVSGSAATFNLQAGTVNTLAIVPGATSGGFQLINIPRCS